LDFPLLANVNYNALRAFVNSGEGKTPRGDQGVYADSILFTNI